jgi:ubiquinone/menaquinone biosynthesis C-methylase UbiE
MELAKNALIMKKETDRKEVFIKLFKFCCVGGTGAVITWGGTYILTEYFKLWYMLSVVLATFCAIISNFTLNYKWTFRECPKPSDPEYEWYSFYHGNLIQKWWKRSIAKIIWKWIPSSSFMLDLGCGSSPIISKYPRAIGIDSNDAKLAFMRTKLKTNYFRNMSIVKLDYPQKSVDYVLCIEVLEHLQSPEMVIEEISRVLKVDGKAVLATPDYSRKWWYLAEMFTLYKKEHVTKFTRRSLEDMCRKSGLYPVKHKYIAGCDYVGLFIKR